MKIDEAIVHAREIAKQKYAEGMLCHANPNDEKLDGCIECAKEHEQLADWLEELKKLRRQNGQGGMKMKAAERMLNDIFWLIWAILIIDLIWQGLEVMFYGDVQPRKVDEIISLIWIGLVVKAYYRGWEHSMEAQYGEKY